MSVANPSRAALRNMSYTVQLAPYLVESICELTRAVRDKTYAQSEISGLLFGSSETGWTVVKALKNFKDSGPRSDLARRERLDKAFTYAVAEAAQDTELAALKLVGWFSVRGSSGLLSSDIDFHNRHFKNSEDLALVIWREAETQAIAEVYSKGEDSRLSSEDYRWSSVRLSTEIRRVSEPIDLAMRAKVSEDAYLKTYQGKDSERRDEWKKMAESAKQTMLSFLPARRKTEALEDSGAATSSGTREPARSYPATSYPVTSLAGDGAREPSRIVEPEGALTVRSPRRDYPEEVSGLPMVIQHARRRPSVIPWVATGLVFLLFSAITFAALAMTGLGSGNGKLAQIVRVLFPGTDLGVRVDSQGGKLLVSWNRHNPTVASANDAILQIFDGAAHREIHLDSGQVADGAVLYTPVTNDVTFRLEVHGTDQSTAMGSLRILDATSSTAGARGDQTLDAAKGTTPASQQPTIPEPAKRAAANARRPIPYRGSQNARISVPTPLPPAQSRDVPSRSPAKPAAPAVNTASNVPTAPAPDFHPNLQPTAGSGSTINGWDSNTPDGRQAAPPPENATAASDTETNAFAAPKPLLQVLPNTKSFPPGTITQVTRVEVQVRIDTGGHVTAARVLNEGVGSILSAAAITAARQWTFQPATMRGEKIPSNHTILFEFRPETLEQ
jgi:TonB family protein